MGTNFELQWTHLIDFILWVAASKPDRVARRQGQSHVIKITGPQSCGLLWGCWRHIATRHSMTQTAAATKKLSRARDMSPLSPCCVL